jgi:hypothetical protein
MLPLAAHGVSWLLAIRINRVVQVLPSRSINTGRRSSWAWRGFRLTGGLQEGDGEAEPHGLPSGTAERHRRRTW